MNCTTTSQTLLEGLKNPQDQVAWRRIDQRFRGMLVAFARKLGLSQTDAEDFSQETLAAFAKGYQSGGFDPARGRLRHWLLGIANHKLRDAIARKNRNREVEFGATPAVNADQIKASDGEISQVWEGEWHRILLQDCYELAHKQFDRRHIEVVRMRLIDDLPPAGIAEKMNITVANVYTITHRVLSYMRTVLRSLEESS